MSSSSKLKIPLQEIKSATDEFAEANVIGKGGYGIVYQGQSEQHGKLAIKRLNRVHSGQGEHEYGMEVTLLSKYRHENLVSLIGYCGEGEEKILVYKYEENQSLDKFLHSKDLSWIRRLHICLDAARGLRYLHSETGFEHGVIHRDIKSSNILLDENWRAKISDFGLSKIAVTNSADSVMFTVPCGTMGYVDPQILYGCGITQKSDVYSFGVVLYEVLFGKLVAIPEYVCDGHFTVQMAKKHYEEKTLQTMIDHDLSIEMNTNSLSTFSTIAYQCLKKRTEVRPTMSEVVEALEKALGYQQGTTRESFGLSLSSVYSYDVYVSFRVQRPEIGVVDRLYDVLEREGLSAYKDNFRNFDNELALLSTIKQSRSFIIVFSKDFAANSWNLYEVAAIIRCAKKKGRVVIPVFYGLFPSEVKEQKDSFNQVSIFDSDARIGEWRNALVEAASLPGIELHEFFHEGREDFANKAVEEIKDRLSRKGQTS